MGYDFSYALRGLRRSPGFTITALAASSFDSQVIAMVVSTTQPGFQFYTDNVGNMISGKAGHQYGNHNAISIETENYPDAPSHPPPRAGSNHHAGTAASGSATSGTNCTMVANRG